MMTGYVLSVLGIVIAGVIIDAIIPAGNISKYIKSIYSVFVILVLINPLISLINKGKNVSLTYNEFELNETLLNYINSKNVSSLENTIETDLNEQGFNEIMVKLNYSTENNELTYKLCKINLKNLVISEDKQHINKYEFIRKVVQQHVNLTDEEIIFDE